MEKIETITKTGIEVTINTDMDTTTVEFSHPQLKCDGSVKDRIYRTISQEQGHEGIWAGTHILKSGKAQRVFLAFNNKEIIEIEKYFNEIDEQGRSKKKRQEKEEEAKEKAMEEARLTGKPVLLYQYNEECNSPHEECSVDNVYIYAMPSGLLKKERNHSW